MPEQIVDALPDQMGHFGLLDGDVACAANCDGVCRQKVVTFAASALQARRVYILCKCYKTAGFRCPLHVLGTGFLWWSTVGAFLSQLEGVHACAAAALGFGPEMFRAHIVAPLLPG